MNTAYKSIHKSAYAKINLSLEILDKRADGYHNILSVMHKTTLCDDIFVEILDKPGITLDCDRNVCAPEDNLAYKAADRYICEYQKLTGKSFGVHITIKKNIPDMAGLAGGSADCAAVLDAMFDLVGGVDYSIVESIASSLGSDINFCLERYICALCSDRGIALDKCKAMKQMYCVICVPDFKMKTSEIYSEYDKMPNYFDNHPSKNIYRLLTDDKTDDIYNYVVNSFSPLCEKRCPDITYIKDVMKQFQSKACEMSGSGSSVFGLFDSSKSASEAYDFLKNKYHNIYLCTTLSE